MTKLADVPYLPAYGMGGPIIGPDVITLHTPQAPETAGTAESVARYFAGGSTRASTHFCTDSDSAVQCVPLDRRCNGAGEGPANAVSWQFEMAGYAEQDRAEWLDPYSRATLVITASICRDLMALNRSLAQPIRARHLSSADLRAGRYGGFTGHGDWHEAFPEGDYRSDPGAHFPWDVFLMMVGNQPTETDWQALGALLEELVEDDMGLHRRWVEADGSETVLIPGNDGILYCKRQIGGHWTDELPLRFDANTVVQCDPRSNVTRTVNQFVSYALVQGKPDPNGKPQMLQVGPESGFGFPVVRVLA